jgi:hypothetical protein
MNKARLTFFFATVLLLALIPLLRIGPSGQYQVLAQSLYPDPANEHACPSQTGAGGGAEAIPAFIGPGSDGFSPNQSLCLPQLAPVPSSSSPFSFIVGGAEPGDRVDSQGTIYVESIRGVPGGVDLWRWNPSIEGTPNANGTLPFKYEGQPDNCGIFGLNGGGCVNNTGSPTNLGVAPGGGDADIAVNAPDPNNSAIPNLAFSSLTLAPGVTATNSRNRGDVFFTPPNVVAALVPGDDRMWNDAADDPSTVYMSYHDLATFNIEVQRSNNGGLTYAAGVGEALDAATLPVAGSLAPTDSGNVAAQIKVDRNTSSCPSKGNLYVAFVAPDSATENSNTGPLRSVYVGVSTDAGQSVHQSVRLTRSGQRRQQYLSGSGGGQLRLRLHRLVGQPERLPVFLVGLGQHVDFPGARQSRRNGWQVQCVSVGGCRRQRTRGRNLAWLQHCRQFQ